MKRVVIPVAFPSMKGDESLELDFELAEGGQIVDCILQVKQSVPNILMAKDAGKPQLEIIPTMLLSIDPDAKPVKRHFLVIQPLQVAETTGELAYRGRFLYPDGRMQVLFEEIGGEAPPLSNFGEPG